MKKELVEIFEDCVDEWKFTTRLRPETIRGYKAVFELFLRTMPEVVVIDDLTPEMLNEYFKRIETRKRIVGRNTFKSGVKKTTIKTHWSKLNVFFKWLKENGHLEENPLKGIKPPKISYDDFKRIEDNKVNKIYSSVVLRYANAFTTRRDTFMISLLLFTGVRKGEFISLRVSDIDLYKNEITIRKETSKSGKQRTLPMNPTLVMHLKDYLIERNSRGYKTESLITSSKRDWGLSVDGLKHWTGRINEMSGVKFHLHQFRHTFACKLVEGGVNAFKIQKLMGHTSITMTMKYLRSLQTEDMAQDVGKIAF